MDWSEVVLMENMMVESRGQEREVNMSKVVMSVVMKADEGVGEERVGKTRRCLEYHYSLLHHPLLSAPCSPPHFHQPRAYTQAAEYRPALLPLPLRSRSHPQLHFPLPNRARAVEMQGRAVKSVKTGLLESTTVEVDQPSGRTAKMTMGSVSEKTSL